MPPTALLTISNLAGPSEVSVFDVDSTASWIRVDWGRQSKPYRLLAGAKLQLNCRVMPSQLPRDSYHQGRVLIRSSAGEDDITVQVTPALEVFFSAFNGYAWQDQLIFDVVLDNRSLEKILLQVRVLKGVATLTGVSTDAPEFVTAVLSSGDPGPRVLDARDPRRSLVELTLNVDEAGLLRSGAQCPAERDITVSLHFGDETRTGTVKLRLWNPPQLQIPDEHDYTLEAIAGKRHTLTLTLANRNPSAPGSDEGNAPLVVTSVEARVRRVDSVGQAASARASEILHLDSRLPLPISIPGGR